MAEVVGACSGGAVLTGWAIHLGAGPLLTGIVMALPQLAQVLQIPAAWSTAIIGHRRAAIVLVALQRQAALPLAVLPFLPLPDAVRQTVLVVVAALAAVLGVLGNNAWVSWMGELVPARIRGRYFGRRTALCTMGGAIASAAAGLLLDAARCHGLAGPGLAALQVLACICGVVTTVLMARQHDPSPLSRSAGPTLRRTLQPFRDASVRGFLGYLLAWNFAIGLAGSFFALHMLQNLRMGFALVALQGAGVAFVRMLAAPVWGALMDRVGARPVLVTCSFAISVIPFIWLFPTPDLLWPLAIDSLLTGVLWSGHNLAAFSLPLSITTREDRPYYLGFFAAVGGGAFALATAAGGLLARAFPDRIALGGHDLHALQLLFAFSGVLRLGASFIGLRIHGASGRDVSLVLHAVGERIRAPQPAAPGSGSRRAA